MTDLDIVEAFWDLHNSWLSGNYERSRLLIGVVMSGKIYFNKKKGITTPELSFIYAVYSESKKPNCCMVNVFGEDLNTSAFKIFNFVRSTSVEYIITLMQYFSQDLLKDVNIRENLTPDQLRLYKISKENDYMHLITPHKS